VNGGYPQYHTSGDDLALIRAEWLEQSLMACQRFVQLLEDNRRYVNLSPKGEPRLGKRGLYGAVGGTSPAEREHAMLWVLNQSDGSKSLLEIARGAGLGFAVMRDAAQALEQAGLLASEAASGKRSASRASSRTRGGSKAPSTARRPGAKQRRAKIKHNGVKP
jgi:aminopeptidase-like protein